MPMQQKQISGLGSAGFYHMVYFEWGDPKNERVLVCVHGLTRRGRDFDALATALEDHYRVICVDLPGRGQSDWLAVGADYQPLTYVQGMTALLARLDVEQVDWLGVSLGGLLGMMLAAQPKTPCASSFSTTSAATSTPRRCSASRPTSATIPRSPARRSSRSTCVRSVRPMA